MPIIFTPDNEPYLGRKSLFELDKILVSVLELNSKTAPKTYMIMLTDRQNMACQQISQSIHLLLSIRELIRQGYLLGANVLIRPFIERVTILLYLHEFPDKFTLWNDGWSANKKAPRLAEMLKQLQRKITADKYPEGLRLTDQMNALAHGKPDAAKWNIIFNIQGPGFASSKILDQPEICDDICYEILAWVAIIHAMIVAYFPDK